MIFMNKKGFTLVELLAVIVILGLLIAIISPVVKNLINDSEDSLSEQQKKLVVEATKKYMIENSELLPEGSNRAIVYMSDLIDKGVIDNDKIIDPKSKGEINGCVVVSYNNEFNQYDYNYSENENDCLITVTFDPEGGSVDTTSKQVKFNSTYGELPTPTREGYTFKGWVINLFNKDTALDGYEFNTYYVQRRSGWFVSDYIIVEPEQLYNIVGKSQGLRVNYYDIEKNGVSTNIEGTKSQIQPHGEDIKYVRFNGVLSEKDSFIFYSDYVINSLTVSENVNHTLHAIWEPNSYIVTFDPEGGSVGTTSKQVTFNSTYGELPTPTREGYRFVGWSGKNMFSKDNISSLSYVTLDGNSIIFDGTSAYNNRMTHIYIRGYEDGTRVYDYLFRHSDIGFKSYVLDLPTANNYNRIGFKINTTERDSYFVIKNVLNKTKKYTLSYNADVVDFDHAKAIISNLQLEDGEVATEYEPYQEYSSDTVVTKSNNHTLHAIWEIAS